MLLMRWCKLLPPKLCHCQRDFLVLSLEEMMRSFRIPFFRISGYVRITVRYQKVPMVTDGD